MLGGACMLDCSCATTSASYADMSSSGVSVCSGALSKTLIAPIETIRMQVMGNKVCCSRCLSDVLSAWHPCVLCLRLNAFLLCTAKTYCILLLTAFPNAATIRGTLLLECMLPVRLVKGRFGIARCYWVHGKQFCCPDLPTSVA